MASKKKTPSFDIPDAVRQAGQSGWVYRTGSAGRTRRSAAKAQAEPPNPAPSPASPVEPTVVAPSPATFASRLVGFGLHVAAVPFIVPLFVTAVVSRRLGITNQP